jgi:hypothetical protein
MELRTPGSLGANCEPGDLDSRGRHGGQRGAEVGG